MKKIIVFFLGAALFAGCSNDSEDTSPAFSLQHPEVISLSHSELEVRVQYSSNVKNNHYHTGGLILREEGGDPTDPAIVKESGAFLDDEFWVNMKDLTPNTTYLATAFIMDQTTKEMFMSEEVKLMPRYKASLNTPNWTYIDGCVGQENANLLAIVKYKLLEGESVENIYLNIEWNASTTTRIKVADCTKEEFTPKEQAHFDYYSNYVGIKYSTQIPIPNNPDSQIYHYYTMDIKSPLGDYTLKGDVTYRNFEDFSIYPWFI